MTFPGISPADIFLPSERINKNKWAVIACDQFTAEPDYWKRVEAFVGENESTLNMIYPEAFLGKDREREEKIFSVMKEYLEDGTVEKAVEDGFILTERTTPSGKRIGLIAAIDLENYDYIDETKLIRATEGTVRERLPERVKIRNRADLELPHVMILTDDREKILTEPLYEAILNNQAHRLLYDFDLMEDGGHLRGWEINSDSDKEHISSALKKLQSSSDGFLFAVGDGNHSLAAAKDCWEEVKKKLGPEEKNTHPMRFALCEIVNLHSEALNFEPIHRVLFNCKKDDFEKGFEEYIKGLGFSMTEGNEISFISAGEKRNISIKRDTGILPLKLIQDYCDIYLKEHSEVRIDYIHGEDSIGKLTEDSENLGILLQAISKDSFFDAIRAGGHFPRKTFSMGEAREKRYYMECRKIRN